MFEMSQNNSMFRWNGQVWLVQTGFSIPSGWAVVSICGVQDLWLESSSWVSFCMRVNCYHTVESIETFTTKKKQFNPQKESWFSYFTIHFLVGGSYSTNKLTVFGIGGGRVTLTSIVFLPFISLFFPPFSLPTRPNNDQTVSSSLQTERTVPTTWTCCTCIYMLGLTSCVFSVPLHEELLLVPAMGGGKYMSVKVKNYLESPLLPTYQLYTHTFTCRLCSCCWILTCAAFLSALAEGKSRRWGRVNRLLFYMQLRKVVYTLLFKTLGSVKKNKEINTLTKFLIYDQKWH